MVAPILDGSPVTPVYRDKSGRCYVLVAPTRSGVHAWFRPIEHSDDGHYDVRRRVADLQEQHA